MIDNAAPRARIHANTRCIVVRTRGRANTLETAGDDRSVRVCRGMRGVKDRKERGSRAPKVLQ